jgi:hypothetical protein
VCPHIAIIVCMYDYFKNLHFVFPFENVGMSAGYLESRQCICDGPSIFVSITSILRFDAHSDRAPICSEYHVTSTPRIMNQAWVSMKGNSKKVDYILVLIPNASTKKWLCSAFLTMTPACNRTAETK